jgi:hypothetical protein
MFCPKTISISYLEEHLNKCSTVVFVLCCVDKIIYEFYMLKSIKVDQSFMVMLSGPPNIGTLPKNI